MNKILVAALLLGTVSMASAIAQTTPSSSSTAPPAVASAGANNTTAAPVAGANSFTMTQAQKRIEDQGYTQVTALVKDDNSVWRGRAMMNGKALNVALDYQGNITAN